LRVTSPTQLRRKFHQLESSVSIGPYRGEVTKKEVSIREEETKPGTGRTFSIIDRKRRKKIGGNRKRPGSGGKIETTVCEAPWNIEFRGEQKKRLSRGRLHGKNLQKRNQGGIQKKGRSNG